MIKSFQKVICVIMLILVLIPCMALAQDDVRTYSKQTFSNEELAQMLAPIALYPDPLLSQILMAATYPFEVVEAERWVTRNPYVKGDALDEALQVKDWDVSILALCHYPKILTMMGENLSWTARLGDAFTNQEDGVMDTVQELRARARAAGNLSTTPEQRVIVDERYIRIEPVNTEYVYVPGYDPYAVYGNWWLPLFPPLPIILPGLVVTGPDIVFSPRFYVGFGVFGWSSFNWRDRHVFITDIDRTRRFNRHYYGYRGPDRRPWRPDHDRRYVREKRGGEIPRFRPPVNPLPPDDRSRIKERDRRTVTPHISGPGGKPDAGPSPDDRSRIKDRDKRTITPYISGPGGKPDAGPSPDDRSRIKDRDKRTVTPYISGPGGKPDTGKPGVINRGGPQPSGPGTIDQGQPVIHDRGNVEVNGPPAVEQKGMGPGRDRGGMRGGDRRP